MAARTGGFWKGRRMKPHYGMIHGRFRPFHLGHLTYLRSARKRCQTGVTRVIDRITAGEL